MPVLSRHVGHSEPGPLPEDAIPGDRDPGDCKDLLYEEEPGTALRPACWSKIFRFRSRGIPTPLSTKVRTIRPPGSTPA
ncbi:MAG TPA: hypothetical protein VLY83_01290 [Methanoregula sp.]|nr:hypothetical protein [Methanoregula sp.]